MDVLKRGFGALGKMWGNLSTSKRTIVGALAAAIFLLLVWGAVSSTGDAMVRVVGHEVDDQTRADILKKLQERNEKYEVRDRDIYLPRETADRVVLELAGEGVMSDRAMWQWLETSDILAPRWQLEKRYQVALQRKLEMMIRKIDGVRSASVVLSPASENPGFRDSVKASASVQVELKPMVPFGSKQAQAVAGLVARAVPGLDADRVHITDNQGKAYRVPREDGSAGVGGDLRELEARLETDIKAKIMDLFPGASVAVRVVAKTVGSHTVDKRFFKKVPKIEEDRERVVKGELPQEGAAAGRSEKETYTRSENLVDEVIKELNDPAGSIEKITIAVRIPQEPGMTLEQAKSLIAKTAAIPLDDALLAVHFTPVKSPEAIPSPTTPSLSEQLSANGGTVGVIVLAALGLILLVWVLRRAMPKGTVEEIEALTAQLAPGPELEAPQAVVAEADSVLRMKEGIQDIIGRNPAGAAAGLKQWMSESR